MATLGQSGQTSASTQQRYLQISMACVPVQASAAVADAAEVQHSSSIEATCLYAATVLEALTVGC
jgi:hypothetical protein